LSEPEELVESGEVGRGSSSLISTAVDAADALPSGEEVGTGDSSVAIAELLGGRSIGEMKPKKSTSGKGRFSAETRSPSSSPS